MSEGGDAGDGLCRHSADDAMQEQRRARVERAREQAVANRKRREREAKLLRWSEEARIKAEDELAKEEAGGTVSKVRIEDVKKFNEVFHDVEPLEPSETARARSTIAESRARRTRRKKNSVSGSSAKICSVHTTRSLANSYRRDPTSMTDGRRTISRTTIRV